MKTLFSSLGLVAAGLVALPAQDDVEARLARLEAEHARMRAALEASEKRNLVLEAEVDSLRGTTEDLRASSEVLAERALEERINDLVATPMDDGFVHATKSGKSIRFYGFVRMDAYYDTGRFTDPIIPYAVLPETGGPGDDDSQFAFDARLTRFAMEIDAGKIAGADVMGKLETDFANFTSGSTESRPAPRIRLAYIDMDFGDFDLRIGQDWDVISPLHPAVHSELLLWGAGNLGDRRTQVQLAWSGGDPEGTQWTFELSAGLTGAVDGADNDGIGGRTNVDGFNSGLPHLQTRLGGTFDSWVEGERASVGVWGYVARLETDTSFGGEDEFSPHVLGVDFVLPIVRDFTLRGEAWYGQALSDVRGNILQDINTMSGEEIGGWGGFAELHWQTGENLRLAVGGSIDDTDDDDLQSMVGGENRSLNWTLYLSSKYDLGNGLFTGFDVLWWETHWEGLGIGNAIRANWWIQLNF